MLQISQCWLLVSRVVSGWGPVFLEQTNCLDILRTNNNFQLFLLHHLSWLMIMYVLYKLYILLSFFSFPQKHEHKSNTYRIYHALKTVFWLLLPSLGSRCCVCSLLSAFQIGLPEGGLQLGVSDNPPFAPYPRQKSVLVFVTSFSSENGGHRTGGVQTEPFARGDREAPGEREDGLARVAD